MNNSSSGQVYSLTKYTGLEHYRLKDMPQSDLKAEGGLWSSLDEFINLFGSPERVVWVVRFRLVMPHSGQVSSNELLVQNLDNWNQPVVGQ